MLDFVEPFFRRLHREHLKPRGYTKVRRTFSRDMQAYIERVQFQGSSWNDANSPWRFYINFGLQFRELQERSPARDFPQTHCWTRIEHLVPDAPQEYDLSEGDSPCLLQQLPAYIELASHRVAKHIHDIRKDYERTRSSRLTLQA